MRRFHSSNFVRQKRHRGTGFKPVLSGGFTLVEVLAALLLIAIVIPVVMQGMSLGSNAASKARHRDEAAGLAQSKLSEIIATGQYQNGVLAGDFSPDWPDYRWEAHLQPIQNSSYSSTGGATLQELNLQVLWQGGGKPDSLTLSTFVYKRASQ